MKKLSQLRPCDNCGGPINPILYQVTVQQCGIDNNAVRKGLGLADFFGGGGAGLALAGIMGTDDDVVKPIGEPVDLVLCTSCVCYGGSNQTPLAILIEQRAQQLDKQRQEKKEEAA